jgi:hypothetical protein
MFRPLAPALLIAGSLAILALPLSAAAQETPSPAPDAPSAAPSLTPSEAAAAGLAAKVPDEIAGMTLLGASFTAADILMGLEMDELTIELAAIAAAHDAPLNEFSIASHGGTDGDAFVTIVAGSIPGVPAAAPQEAFVKVLVGDSDAQLTTTESIAGRDVTVVKTDADADATNTLYVVPHEEVVWVAVADPGSLDAVIEALPSDE